MGVPRVRVHPGAADGWRLVDAELTYAADPVRANYHIHVGLRDDVQEALPPERFIFDRDYAQSKASTSLWGNEASPPLPGPPLLASEEQHPIDGVVMCEAGNCGRGWVRLACRGTPKAVELRGGESLSYGGRTTPDRFLEFVRPV